MRTISDGLSERSVLPEDAEFLRRSGVIYPCDCDEVCGKPGQTYHPEPGYSMNDVAFELNSLCGG